MNGYARELEIHARAPETIRRLIYFRPGTHVIYRKGRDHDGNGHFDLGTEDPVSNQRVMSGIQILPPRLHSCKGAGYESIACPR